MWYILLAFYLAVRYIPYVATVFPLQLAELLNSRLCATALFTVPVPDPYDCASPYIGASQETLPTVTCDEVVPLPDIQKSNIAVLLSSPSELFWQLQDSIICPQ